MTQASAPPPGWYPDPEDPRKRLWWDGTRWSYRILPTEAAPSGQGEALEVPTRSDAVRVLVTGLVMTAVAAMIPFSGMGSSRPGRATVAFVVGLPTGVAFCVLGCLGLYACSRGIPNPAPWWGRAVQLLVRR